MESLLQVVLIVFIVIFCLTALLCLLAIAKFGSSKWSLVTIQEHYLRRLFATLILEIVASVMAVGAIAIHHLQGAASEINKGLRRLTLEESDWIALSQSWLKEPSGICGTDLEVSENVSIQVALVVNDDSPELSAVEQLSDALVVRRPIPFDGLEPDDLEAICWDGRDWYYAMTSHRRLSPGKGTERMLLRFRIDRRRWRDWDYRISDTIARDLTADGLMGNFLRSQGVQVDDEMWSRKADEQEDWHPYAVEVEGLASRYGKLLMGLKWPLHEGKALLVIYDWDANRFERLLRLDLQGFGISALEFDNNSECLIVIGNPPQKERKDNAEDYRQCFGRSIGVAFEWRRGEAEPTGPRRLVDLERTNTRLEGIAVVGPRDDRRILLAYDGARRRLQAASLDSVGLK